MSIRALALVGLGLVAALAVTAQEVADRPPSNWPAPPYWLPASGAPEAREAVDQAAEPVVVRALPLVAIPACRLLDTRGEGLAALATGAGQEIGVVGRCGIPAQAQGVSVRLLVSERTGGGDVSLAAAGEGRAGAGRLALDATATGVTTGVVGLDGTGRVLATAESGSAHVIVEVNGYYAAEPAVRSLNAVAGDVTLKAGENIEITTEGSVVTIAVGGSPPREGERPGEPEPSMPGVRGPARHLVQVPASPQARALPPVKAMAPPSSSMYVAGALGMPDTTALGAGVLALGGDRFLHNYGPATDAGNTFLGENAGNFTMGGANWWEGKSNTGLGYGALVSNTTGSYNIASGYHSLSANTTGYGNTASGYHSLYANTTGFANTASGSFSLSANTTGYWNTANGSWSLYANTTGHSNTASGSSSLSANTTGYGNTANGYYSLVANTEGYLNTASGYYSLVSNTEGSFNTASGYDSLYSNTTGYSNTASGYNAGVFNTTGSNNTFVGADSDAAANDLTNATAVGNGAIVDASNHVRIGDIAVTQIGGQVGWSNLSDVRHKEAIRDLELGLDFVVGLRPVAFRMRQGNGRTDMGFLAQDIEALLGDGYNLVGIGQDTERTLSLRATDLIAPLVKAIQDQQELIEAQQARLERLEREVEALRSANAGR